MALKYKVVAVLATGCSFVYFFLNWCKQCSLHRGVGSICLSKDLSVWSGALKIKQKEEHLYQISDNFLYLPIQMTKQSES